MGHLSRADDGDLPPPSVAAAAGDDVFKALADPSRRLLLDSLFSADGQSLGELSAHLPTMTRFGVMKHLRLLEAAGLITTRKIGREKLHYLNPVPIRLIHNRWIGKYAEPWVGTLADLKTSLEQPARQRPRHVFQLYVRAAPDRLWEAITDPDLTLRYFHNSRVESTWCPGDRVAYWIHGQLVVEGQVLEADPPRKLVTSWAFRRNPRLMHDPPSRVTWEIEPSGLDVSRLTVVHDDFASETATFRSVGAGWPLVLSSLKSLLETGKGLAVAE
jgi:uncharacterized protein YndB with AHSA1/START domain/DNA-binding transcriptional ArsR family regulator